MGILCKRSCSSPKGHSQPQTKRPSRLPNRKKKPSAARQYEWGHYGSDRAALEQDLLERVESYQQQFSVKVAQIEAPGLYKYYSTQRPVDIGTFPKPAGNEPDEIENYDKRVPVEGGAFLAWGHEPHFNTRRFLVLRDILSRSPNERRCYHGHDLHPAL